MANVDKLDCACVRVHSQRVRVKIMIHPESIGAECLYDTLLVRVESQPVLEDARCDFELRQPEVDLYLEQIAVLGCV